MQTTTMLKYISCKMSAFVSGAEIFVPITTYKSSFTLTGQEKPTPLT